jgi:hypothetical protein
MEEELRDTRKLIRFRLVITEVIQNLCESGGDQGAMKVPKSALRRLAIGAVDLPSVNF